MYKSIYLLVVLESTECDERSSQTGVEMYVRKVNLRQHLNVVAFFPELIY